MVHPRQHEMWRKFRPETTRSETWDTCLASGMRTTGCNRTICKLKVLSRFGGSGVGLCVRLQLLVELHTVMFVSYSRAVICRLSWEPAAIEALKCPGDLTHC